MAGTELQNCSISTNSYKDITEILLTENIMTALKSPERNSAIGGYFGLECVSERKPHLHKSSIHLNTARNAFEYILLVNSYQKVYIPYYTCEVMLEPVQKHSKEYAFYHVDGNFQPIFDYNVIKENEAFLYTNYFGIKDKFIQILAKKCRNLIIDNAQSLFSKPVRGIPTFYSPRKFVGISDGAFLYCDKKLTTELEQDISYKRMQHLLKRIDLSAEEGYADFVANDASLENNEIMEMSKLTKWLLAGVDFPSIAKIRKRNFDFLHKSLESLNKIQFELNRNSVPLVYPFWTKDKALRARLIENRIYNATYWPNVDQWAPIGLEHHLKDEIVHLPIDQRYATEDMQRILNLIKHV